jgi:hypothetical protein
MYYYTVGGHKYHYRSDCGRGKKYMAFSLDKLPKKATIECKHCKDVLDRKWAMIRACNDRKVKKVQEKHDSDAVAGIRKPRRIAMTPLEFQEYLRKKSN